MPEKTKNGKVKLRIVRKRTKKGPLKLKIKSELMSLGHFCNEARIPQSPIIKDLALHKFSLIA